MSDRDRLERLIGIAGMLRKGQCAIGRRANRPVDRAAAIKAVLACVREHAIRIASKKEQSAVLGAKIGKPWIGRGQWCPIVKLLGRLRGQRAAIEGRVFDDDTSAPSATPRMTTINHNAVISLPNLEKSKVPRHSPGLAPGEDVMGNWRVFLAGMFCGTLLQMAVIGGFWWKSACGHTDLQEDWIVVRSAEDEELYDRCLADSGNIVACDATMRLLERYRAAENAEMTSI
jgi:hypothetical protein